MTTQLAKYILAEDDHFLSAELQTARVAAELRSRNARRQLSSEQRGNWWAGEDIPWARILGTGNKEKLRLLDKIGELRHEAPQCLEAVVKLLAGQRAVRSGAEVSHKDKCCRGSLRVAGEEGPKLLHDLLVIQEDIRNEHKHGVLVFPQHGLVLD